MLFLSLFKYTKGIMITFFILSEIIIKSDS
jgi:hypothetical protein